MSKQLLFLFFGLMLGFNTWATMDFDKIHFVSHENQIIKITITNDSLEQEDILQIDCRTLKGEFVSSEFNQTYKTNALQIDPIKQKVYFKLSGKENDTLQQYFYAYDIDYDTTALVYQVSNETINWWQLFHDNNFIIAYGEEEFSFLYLDLEENELYDIAYAEDSLDFVDAHLKENQLQLVGKEGQFFMQWQYNIDDDLAVRDTLFGLEFDSASLVFNPPFLLETNYRKEYVLLHSTEKIFETKLRYKGRKLWIDNATKQILLPTKTAIHSYDFELNLIDSISIENGTIYTANNESFFVKEVRDTYGDNEFYYIISKDFKHNKKIDGSFLPDSLIYVKETRKED